MYYLRTLDSPGVFDEEGKITLGPGKPLALLVYVAFLNRAISRTELAELLWPGVSPERAKASTRQALWILKRTIGPEVFASLDPVELAPDSITADFERLRTALKDDRFDVASDCRRRPFLADFPPMKSRDFERWIEDTRHELDRLYCEALTVQASDALGHGDHVRVIGLSEAVLAVDAHRLDAHRLRILAFKRVGQLAEAREALIEAEVRTRSLPSAVVAIDQLRRLLIDASPADPQTEDSLAFEFVGRSTESSVLRRRVSRMLAGFPSVTAISGPRGIGKSRLVAEARLAAVPEEHHFVRVQCHEPESDLAWGVVTDLVISLGRLPGAAAVTPTSEASLNLLAPSRANGRGSVNAGTSPTSVPSPMSTYAEAVLDLVTAVAFETPVMVVVEDVHWCDPESGLVLTRLARRLERHSVMLVFTAEDQAQFASMLPSESDVIRLTPMPRAEVNELVSLSVDVDVENGPEILEEIVRLAAGSPGFTSDILGDLIRRGLIVPNEGSWLLDASTLTVPLAPPPSVNDQRAKSLAGLSEAALRIAAALQRSATGLSRRELPAKTRLSEVQVDQALREMSDGGLINAEPEGVRFAHQSVRELHARLQGQETTTGLRKYAGLVTGTVAAAVAVLVLWASSTSAPPYPYGKGVIVLSSGERLWGLRSPGEESGVWEVRPLDRPWSQDITGVRRTASGEVVWFGGVPGPGGDPAGVEYSGDQTNWSRVYDTPQLDDNFKDVSPDGQWSLIRREDPVGQSFSMQDIAVHRETGQEVVLSRTGGWPGRIGPWSPDGRVLPLSPSRDSDMIQLLGAGGRLLGSIRAPDHDPVGGVRFWCDDGVHIATTLRRNGAQVPGLLNTETGTVHPVRPDIAYGSVHGCLGDQNAVLFHGIVDGTLQLALAAPGGDSIINLSRQLDGHLDVADPLRPLGWLDDEPPVTVSDFEIGHAKIRMRWGQSDTLRVQTSWSDGVTRDGVSHWESRSPSIASVDGTGIVTANGAGSTWLIAYSAGWFADSVEVEVFEDTEGGPVLFDEFERLDRQRWVVHHGHPATTGVLDGSHVLLHNGDGEYNDPLYTRIGVPLPIGGTLEVEARLPLTRSDRQRLIVCLSPGAGSHTGDRPPPSIPDGACVQYPSAELELQRRDLGLVIPGRVRTDIEVPMPADFDHDSWNHIAIQVLPDGTFEFFLNREFWYAVPWKARLAPDTSWRVVLAGAAVETSLTFRKLRIWSGPRFRRGTVN